MITLFLKGKWIAILRSCAMLAVQSLFVLFHVVIQSGFIGLMTWYYWTPKSIVLNILGLIGFGKIQMQATLSCKWRI